MNEWSKLFEQFRYKTCTMGLRRTISLLICTFFRNLLYEGSSHSLDKSSHVVWSIELLFDLINGSCVQLNWPIILNSPSIIYQPEFKRIKCFWIISIELCKRQSTMDTVVSERIPFWIIQLSKGAGHLPKTSVIRLFKVKSKVFVINDSSR